VGSASFLRCDPEPTASAFDWATSGEADFPERVVDFRLLQLLTIAAIPKRKKK
jgi:hypothetical protein